MNIKLINLIDMVSVEVGAEKLCANNSSTINDICSISGCKNCCLSSRIGNRTSKIYQELIYEHKINKPSSDS